MHDRPFVQGAGGVCRDCASNGEGGGKTRVGIAAQITVYRELTVSMPCCRGLLEEDFRVFRQRNEGFRLFIQGKNLAAFTSYTQPCNDGVITQAHRDGRVGLNVAQLRKHVLLHHRIDFIDRFIPGFLPRLSPRQNSAASVTQQASVPGSRYRQSPSSRHSWSDRKSRYP